MVWFWLNDILKIIFQLNTTLKLESKMSFLKDPVAIYILLASIYVYDERMGFLFHDECHISE